MDKNNSGKARHIKKPPKGKQFDFTFKIVMIGDSGVGKSCILLRFADDKFNENFYATIGVDFRFKNLTVDDKQVKLQIWDTAGQEKFKTITSAYYRGAHGIIIVYDISDKNSFLHIKDWLDDINKYTDDNPIRLVVGNKSDLSDKRQVSQVEINNFKQQTGIDVIEASAKSSDKIYEVMETMTRMLISKKTRKGSFNKNGNYDTPEQGKISLNEIFEDDKHYSLIMEECTGGELFQKIMDKAQKDEAFSEKEAVVIFKQIMSAVSYCHSQGICHRDLKPENILFLNKEPDSPIKIVDFGLSKIFGEIKPIMKGNKIDKNTMSARVGTPYYMSPEVLQGNYDNKCDIWSCGVILYILLCGYPPFDGETDHEIFKAISRKKFHFPEEEWKTISDDAKDLIKHMICDSEKRFNAEMVLNHPWIEKGAPNAKGSLSSFNSNSLKNYILI